VGPLTRPGGGIGRRGGLKHLFPRGSTGSSPVPGTTQIPYRIRVLREIIGLNWAYRVSTPGRIHVLTVLSCEGEALDHSMAEAVDWLACLCRG
jgi:hypothetical protein